MVTGEQMRRLLDRFVRLGLAGCGAAVSVDGQEVFSYCAGFADVKNGVPMRDDTIVRLFSCTKIFTVVTALTLWERGEFSFDDPIETYLPEWKTPKVGFYASNGIYSIRPAARSILIKDLFVMGSGLPYGSTLAGGACSKTHMEIEAVMNDLEAQGGYTTRELSRRLSTVPLLFDPGSGWTYGLSHDILGALVEAIVGQPFGEYMYKNLLEPLGLYDTFFFLPEDKKDRLCRCYQACTATKMLTESQIRVRQYDPTHRCESGGAGLLTTLHDFSIFTNMLANSGVLGDVRILGRKTVDFLRLNHLSSPQLEQFRTTHDSGWEFLKGYGYGLGVRTLIDPAAANAIGSPGEFGWWGAAGTYFLVDPVHRLSLAYIQQMLPNSFENICQPLLRTVGYTFLDQR